MSRAALRVVIAPALALLVLLLAAPASAQDYGGLMAEIITDFRSDITVARDGTLAVTETITVIAQNERINHGIFRDFPTSYKDRLGRRVRVRFDVQRVTRDGNEEPYALESLSNGVRVKIGSGETVVSRGPHTYVIIYTTNRQVGFFEDHDDLTWNVTGNGWVFPIVHAAATISLPPAARIKQHDFYTGPQGVADKAATARVLSDSSIAFETTETLQAGHGLTVAVGFSKGVVEPPSAREEASAFARDNASIAIALLGLILVSGFYYFIWYRVGRDPDKGTVIPLFAPPRGFSPAAVRFVHRMGYDRKAFSAALIDMAVKGYLKIEENDRYTLARTGRSEAETGLSNGERAIATALFGRGGTAIELKQANHAAISRAISALKDSLRNEYEANYFNTNSLWFYAGLAILAVAGLAAAALADEPEAAGGMLFWLSGWSVACAFLVHRAANAWNDVLSGPGSRIGNIIGAVFFTVFALPFVGALLAAIFLMSDVISPLVLGSLAAAGMVAYIFYHLLKAPTLLGARTLAEIEGFRLYLDTAEKQRLEYLHPPDVTPEVFEKFLPYAVALDCENNWSRKFEAEAARAAQGADAATYHPGWYSGHSFTRFGTGAFASSIGSSIASAAASSSSAPGSSSGSSGGGFSGGGGGGGGGGGW